MNEIYQRLLEYYTSFLAAVPRLGLAVLIVVAGVFLARWIGNTARRRISSKSNDPLMSHFLSKSIKVVAMILVILLSLRVAGLGGIAGAFMATAGASVVVIGFAFKDIAENFLAGVILAFNRPFDINDTVQIEDIFGKVKTMEFRYTKITTFDGKNVYIPNADILTKPVKNYTEDGFFRIDFIVGIAYENDINKAKDIIKKILDARSDLVQDSEHINFVVEDELAASTVNLKVFIWVTTEDFRRQALETRGRVMQEVKTSLEADGFNLPANISELKFYDGSRSFQVKQDKDPA